MPHRPQHGCAVILIECITHVNEEEPLVLLLGMLLSQKPHRVDPPFNPRLQATADMLSLAGLLGLCLHHHQHTLHQHLPPGLPHAYWLYPREIFEAGEAPQHQCPVGRQGWETIGHPVTELPNNLP